MAVSTKWVETSTLHVAARKMPGPYYAARMAKRDEFTRFFAFARALGGNAGRRAIDGRPNAQLDPFPARRKRAWRLPARIDRSTPTIQMRVSSPAERDAKLVAALKARNLESDPTALNLARIEYEEGLAETMSERVDRFVRDCLAT